MHYGRDVIYLYDGSFDGLLTAVFDSYYNREIPVAIESGENIQEDLFCDIVTIVSDSGKAERVYKSIKSKISPAALENIYYTYLSDTLSKGRLCLDYIRAGYKFGKNVDMHVNIPCVTAVADAVLRVKNESYQYLQFVRFSELEGGIFYSEIEPKCDVLTLIAPHFKARLSNMPWMIHDIGRKMCMVCNGKSCCLTPTDKIPSVKYSENELLCRSLWKKFYNTIEIKERHNERCRISHMPKRYWKHMTEFEVEK